MHVPLVLKTRGATRPRSPPRSNLSERRRWAFRPYGCAPSESQTRTTKPSWPLKRVGVVMKEGKARDPGPSDYDDTFRRCYGPMVRSLSVACGDGEVAADCVQDAFMRAYARWGRVAKLE